MASAHLSAYPRSLADAKAILGTKPAKRIGNNTWLIRGEAGTVSVVLHATAILTFHAADIVTASSGGFRSNTTRDRLRALGVNVFQVRRVWTVDGQPFVDGMRVTLGPIPPRHARHRTD